YYVSRNFYIHSQPPVTAVLPSFPTRRSSDLQDPPCPRAEAHVSGRPGRGTAGIPQRNQRMGERPCLSAVVNRRARRRARRGSHRDRKSTRLNSSHVATSYAVFCLKKKTDCDT